MSALRGLAFPVVLLLVVGLWGAYFASASVANTLTSYLVMVVLVTGLSVFSGNTGILSFGHVTFAALAAYAMALLTIPAAAKGALLPDLPEWLAQAQMSPFVAIWPVLAAVAAVAVALGLFLARLSGAAAAIATLGLLIITNSVLIGAVTYTRGAQAMVGVPKATTPLVAAGAAVVALTLARLFKDSRWGLLTRAAREDEPAALASGIDVWRGRLVAFVLSAVVTGLGGALFAHHVGVFSPKEFHFTLTFALLAMLIVGGVQSAVGPLVGASVISLLIEVLRRLEPGFALGGLTLPPLFGLTTIGVSLALLATLYFRSEGLMGTAELDDLMPRAAAPLAPSVPRARRAPGPGIMAEGLTKRYGGVTALADVSLRLGSGEILGLIGPNGSGKSTLLSCISGVQPPDQGAVQIDGQRPKAWSPRDFARAGVGRTFQNIRLFGALSAQDNVRAALLARGGVSRDEAASQAAALLEEFGLAEVSLRPARTLAYGQQRRLEIARALATNPGYLLLDEPAAGMNPAESRDLIDMLRRVRDQRGIGILIVDHDLHLILSLCDRVIVLNEGRLIADGAPGAIRADAAVQAAYFGSRRGRGRPRDTAEPEWTSTQGSIVQ